MVDFNADDEDIIKERRDDKEYTEEVNNEQLHEVLKVQTALTDHDIKGLMNQLGVNIYVIELQTLYDRGFDDLKKHRWYLVYCNKDGSPRPAHWISIVKTDENGEELLLVYDSFGRHLEDIFKQHGYDVDLEHDSLYITITGNYQGPISQVCGYYQCLFCALSSKTEHDIELFQELLEHLFIEVNDILTTSEDLGIRTFNNDKIALCAFSKVFDTSELNNTIKRLLEVSVNHQR
jgi:hypothetical protein